jgi:hypothetical protein
VNDGESHHSNDEESPRSWSPNLLTRIATTIGSRQRENVATTALLYVLQADVEARRALVADLARRAKLTLGTELPSELIFVGQDPGADGRPDLVGHDEKNCPRAVIEAKIDAGFQPQQIARYSTRLDSALPCVIAVLAPERRLPQLMREAAAQLVEAGYTLTEYDPTSYQDVTHNLSLLGISWVMTLNAMQDVTSSPDLAQIRGLYTYLEKATFLPFSSADLAASNGRLIWSITSVAQNVAARFEGGRQLHQWSEAGRLLTLNERTAWFGVWFEAWAQRADTPYWMTYHVDALPVATAVPLLPRLNALPGIRAHHDDTYLCVALFPSLGTERGDVERKLAELISQVSQVVQ